MKTQSIKLRDAQEAYCMSFCGRLSVHCDTKCKEFNEFTSIVTNYESNKKTSSRK